MQAIILGTSSAKPTIKRNHPGVWIEVGGKVLLVDCGEGIQRQIITAKKKATKIDYLLITHWHADHSAGVPALMQSMAFNEREKELTIIGPKGTKEKIGLVNKIFPFIKNFPVKIIEANSLKPVKIVDDKEVEVLSVNAKHREACVSYSIKEKDKIKIDLEYTKKFGLGQNKLLGDLQRGKNIVYEGKKILASKATYAKPGKKITYVTDTLPVAQLVKLSENSDILICESTFIEHEKQEAKASTHMTARQAGMIAAKSKAKKLVLTHFSTRYKHKEQFALEAKEEFPNVEIAHDFLELSV